MKWISKLLKKPDAKPSAPANPPTAQAARPVEEAEPLRGALAAAADDNERRQIAARLGRALAARSQAPSAEDPPEVWVAAVCHAPDKALALAWAAGLEDDARLGEVAMQARFAEVRIAAARRIEASAVLEQVAHDSRGKDKGVHRHCADLLRQRRQADASAQRATEILAELHSLNDVAPLPVLRLLDLKKELSALGEAGEPGLECNALMQRALARLEQEVEAQRGLQTQLNAAGALAAECAGAAWPWTERLDAWRARLDGLSQVQAGLPSWLAGQGAARELGKSLAEIETCLAALAADDARHLACEQLLATLSDDRPPDADTVAAWEALAKPDHPAAREPLESRWQALNAVNVPPVAAPPIITSEAMPKPPHRPQPRIDQDALRGLLDQLEQAIGQGHLIDAEAAAKQIKAASGGHGLPGALEARLHTLQAQLEQMRGWARWGTGQALEQLIAAAGELLNGERDVDELAVAIPALREEWKRLNAHGAAAKGQWESFDAALEKAYQPVAARRAEEAARQAEARTAKEALCAEWEAEVAGIAWDQADFKRVETRRAEMHKQWRAAPQAGFRDERTLRKRLDTLIGGIDRRLDAARAAECERREQLIAAAQALHGQADLRQAMAEAKALQQRWSREAAPVRLKRGDEEKLWKRFRAACNAVFARQEALRAEQATQRQERVQSRQMLLDAFAATLTGGDAQTIQRALAQFRTDWGTGKPDPADRLEGRARDLQQQAQQRLDALRNEKYRARFELLAQRAALAERVEAAALAGEPLDAVLAEAKQAWDGLPPLPHKTDGLLAKRFTEASRITREVLASGREAREALLLDLEIALGLPSPKAYAEARRERQLERLQNRFTAAAPQSLDAEELLAHWYATAALPDATSERRVAAVVSRLVEQATPG